MATAANCWTAHEDAAPYYGWMMSYQYNGTALTQKAVLNVTPNTQRGGIWMSGGAPAVDSNNSSYIVTGNGAFDALNSSAPNSDYGVTAQVTLSQDSNCGLNCR